MPSAEEPAYLFGCAMPGDPPSPGYARDVDLLVSRLKENLRLSAQGLKSKHQQRLRQQQARPTPYKVPPALHQQHSALALKQQQQQQQQQRLDSPNNNNSHKDDVAVVDKLNNNNNNHRSSEEKYELDLEDAYQQFQLLLQKGSLIKEAVKRLRTSRDDLFDEEDIFGPLDDKDEEDEKDLMHRRRIQRELEHNTDPQYFKLHRPQHPQLHHRHLDHHHRHHQISSRKLQFFHGEGAPGDEENLPLAL